MHGIAINQMEELLAVESREEERGWGEIRGWHYSTNCGNGSKVGLSGPDDCMEIDPTVTPQDLLCPPPDILKVRNPFLKSAGQVFPKIEWPSFAALV